MHVTTIAFGISEQRTSCKIGLRQIRQESKMCNIAPQHYSYDPKTEMLINEIQKYELIYNCKHEDYKDKKKRLSVWKAVSCSLGLTSQDCKTRWRSLRDRFLKEVKKDVTSRNSTVSSARVWHFYESLKFLLPFTNSWGHINNCLEDKEVMDSSPSASCEGSPAYSQTVYIDPQNIVVPYNDNVPVTSTKGTSKKGKRSEAVDDAFPELTHACCKTKDVSQHFGDYIAAQLRSFDEIKRVRATKRVIEVVLEEELL